MADVPDMLVLKRHRDLSGRTWEMWVRRGLLGLVVVVLALGLANVFGQRPSTATAGSAAGRLELLAPGALRSGLIFQARFTIHAGRDLRRAVLVLGRGWSDGLTINTIEPSPVGEASRGGKLLFTLGHIPAGSEYVLAMQFQVNPTTIGTRAQQVELWDRNRRVAVLDRDLAIYP